MNRITRYMVALTLTVGVTGNALAQQPTSPPAPPVHVPLVPAKPGDVASIDAIVTALYDVISGPVDQRRDWNRMRSLFLPGAKLMPTVRNGAAVYPMSVNDYIAQVGPRLEQGGFAEKEIKRVTEEFGPIAHVFSVYTGKAVDSPEIRGINSIQLFNDGTRWWIVSVYWASETPERPLPAKYLP